MIFQSIFLLAIGLSGTLALPNPLVNPTLSISNTGRPNQFSLSNLLLTGAVPKPTPYRPCPKMFCPLDSSAVRDKTTEKCTCRKRILDPFQRLKSELAERIVDAKTCLALTRCSSGYVANWDSRTKKCGCIPNPSTICLTATTCSSGSQPVWDNKKKICSCKADDAGEQPTDPSVICNTATTCSFGSHPVYDAKKKTCNCEANAGNDGGEEPIDPSVICLTATTCSVGSQPVYDSQKNTCNCVANTGNGAGEDPTDPSVICLTATTCSIGSQPVHDSQTKTCSCKANNNTINSPRVDPTKCPNIRCAAGTQPSWVVSDQTCICKKISGLRATPITSGKVKERDILSPPATSIPQCADMMCVDEKFPRFNTTTQECECVYQLGTEPYPGGGLCPDTMCVAEKEPIYNTTNGLCYCDWLPDFWYKRDAKPVKLPVDPMPKDPKVCSTDVWCIPEMRFVYDEAMRECTCQWIPGLEPSPATKMPLRTPTPKCQNMMCISEKTAVFDPVTGRCGCQWIPGMEPVPFPLTTTTTIATSKSKHATLAPYPTNPVCAIYCPFGLEPGKGCRCRAGDNHFRDVGKGMKRSIPACYNVTSQSWLTCPNPLETPHWEDGKCVCNSSGNSTTSSSTLIHTRTSRPTATPTVGPPFSTTRPLLPTITPKPPITTLPPVIPTTTLETSGSQTTTKTGGGGGANCKGVFCISEQYPVFDQELGRCRCVWIEGFGPVGEES
jgi:hypothetical protein